MSDLSKRPDESLEDLLERLAMPTEHGDPNTATVFIGGDPPVKRPSKPNSQGSSGS